LPASTDFIATMLATYSTFGFLGSTTGTIRSPPPIRSIGRSSVVVRVHVAPASSERYRPLPLPLP
jgi:hypothetical protein